MTGRSEVTGAAFLGGTGNPGRWVFHGTGDAWFPKAVSPSLPGVRLSFEGMAIKGRSEFTMSSSVSWETVRERPHPGHVNSSKKRYPLGFCSLGGLPRNLLGSPVLPFKGT